MFLQHSFVLLSLYRAQQEVKEMSLPQALSSLPSSSMNDTKVGSKDDADSKLSSTGKEGKAIVESGSDSKKPNALESWPSLREKLAGRKLAVFLDYDGTLTPIVSNPSDAKITSDMTAIVDRVSRRHSTAIVTGRAISTIVDFLPLSNVYYAGSHGFDIRAPSSMGSDAQVKQVASSYLPSLEAFYKGISERVAHISGVLVENNKYSISIHYRNVATDDDIRTIDHHIDQLLVHYKDQLKKTHGKKVFEVRPQFDWHKGAAVHWLLTKAFASPSSSSSSSGSNTNSEVVPIYLGDDVTDEDAFREINKLDFAVGIHVRAPDQARATAASYTLSSIDEVALLLAKLCEL